MSVKGTIYPPSWAWRCTSDAPTLHPHGFLIRSSRSAFTRQSTTSISPPPPDDPEAVVPTQPAIQELMSRHLWLAQRGNCMCTSNASKRDSVVYSPQWDSTSEGNCSLLPMASHDWSTQLESSCPITLWKTSSADWSPRIHYPETPPYLVGL